jgi:hypothetical protein
VEAIFLEAALAVLKQGANKLTDRQAAALEGLAFDWIVNAERYIEARFQELVKIRDKMVRALIDIMLLVLAARSPDDATNFTQHDWRSNAALVISARAGMSDPTSTWPPAAVYLQVLESCAVMLGALSQQRLLSIVGRLLREVSDAPGPGNVGRLRSDSPAARQEIFQICRGMKHVRLPLGNGIQVRRGQGDEEGPLTGTCAGT